LASAGVGDGAVLEAGAIVWPKVFGAASRLKPTPAIVTENVRSP
jgi:hypothetical protein